MTSKDNAENDIRNGDAANAASPERRAPSTSFSGSNRFSFASSGTAESSKAASTRSSLAAFPSDDVDGKSSTLEDVPVRDGRGSHRSHRTRASGGFLLSNTTFEPPSTVPKATDHPPKRISSEQDRKGKATLRAPEKKHTKRRSGAGLGIGASPLVFKVTNRDDLRTDHVDGNEVASGANSTATGLDVDSTQLVNLALNLSESRKAARRNVSSPLPPTTPAFGESFAGGSLRQHFQQQRRISRNISPKPDRGDRAVTTSPRVASGQKTNGPLKPAFESDQDGPYQYHFSASTLARAEKAKNTIELMAHYRRLLQYVPPLKPQALERSTTAGSTISDSLAGAPRTTSTKSTVPRQLGREYNPLQYIRNRKVRARERRAIDGEAQGFGDVVEVSSWVDQVSKEASAEDYQAADCLLIPTFATVAEMAASSRTSPHSTSGKVLSSQAKVKRPRVDWITNPADMIADVYWLEQDDNKKSIEDRNGRMIFPRTTDLRRPLSRRSEEPELQLIPGPTIEMEQTKSPDLRIDTRLPEFRSVKPDSEKHSDSAASRAKHKLREATRIHHGHNGSVHRHHLHVRSQSKSDFDSSDSEAASHPTRRRSGTADSHDRGKDILEKQMMEMLANEARHNGWVSEPVEDKIVTELVESEKATPNDQLEKSQINLGHSRAGSVATKESPSRRGSFKNGSSGRESLEMPGFGSRDFLDGLDSSAPNSPLARASKTSISLIPSIGTELSPLARSRPSSPTRNPLSKMKSRISQLQDHSRDRSRSRTAEADAFISPPILGSSSQKVTPESPVTPEKQKRSISPIKKVKTTDSSKSSIRKSGSIRRGKTGDEASGIRGLFKGSRNPVTRVTDFIWKKESSPIGPSSGFSTDESDLEDVHIASDKKDSRNSSITMQHSSDDVDATSPQKERPSYLAEMPVFSSPFSERRSRPSRTTSNETSGNPREEREAREQRRRSSRAHLLETPPRIDVQNASPTSSPDVGPQFRYRRDSSVSDIDDSRRGSFATRVYGADARLNAILGIPGKRSNILFATGLSTWQASNTHRPSLDGKRHWSISDRGVSIHRGPMTKQEIARVRALLLSSGIKAKEIARRASEVKDLHDADEKTYADIAPMAQQKFGPVPKSQRHILAARILTDDVQISLRIWQATAEKFTGMTVENLLDRIEALRFRVVDDLTPMTRNAADEADEVSKDLMTSQLLKVKRITDSMDKMMRQRRRKFRWLRRGGWLLVEWALVGVMWLAWMVVVFVRILMGIGNGVKGVGRWLLFR